MSDPKTVLIVEDEKNIVDILRFNLQRAGYQTLEAYDGEDGLAQAVSANPDLILLDVMLPKKNGFDVCRALRDQGSSVPVIILTAREEEADKVLGLEIGADDYITKPFSMRELVARVKVVLNRTLPKTEAEGGVYTFGGLTVDSVSHSVKIDGQEASLTPKEFDLLVFLATNRGIALSREKILQKVWNYDYYGEDRTVDTHIKMLRSHLGRYRDAIVTVWGIGYKFDPEAVK